jgi:uncharacterized membrane protein
MDRTDLGRIVAFTDGVMAVAITLLVLNIEVPDVTNDSELGEQLWDLVPSLGSYALSFALVGRFWVIHHNGFAQLRAFDGTLMALNLVFLALIALMPFATDLFDRYSDEPISAAVFGTVLGLAALVNWMIQLHAFRAGLIKPERRRDTARFIGPVAFGFTAIFLLSAPLAFVSVHIAQALWISTIVLRYPLRRLGDLIASE